MNKFGISFDVNHMKQWFVANIGMHNTVGHGLMAAKEAKVIAEAVKLV